MSIPLIQDNQKDSINASLIAIKREEERLQALIAEADKKIAQLNELKVSKSDIVDEVTLNNMQSVTSNAVASAFNGFEVEEYGKIGTNGYYVKYANGLMEQYEEKTFPNVTLAGSGEIKLTTFTVNLSKTYKTGTTPIQVDIHVPSIYGRTPVVWLKQGENSVTETNTNVVLSINASYPYNLNGQKYILHTKGWWK